AWALLSPAVTSPILGTRTLAQLEDNLGALAVTFSAGQVARLNTASRVDLGFPHEFLDGPAMSMMFGGVEVGRR
ncbi:MAG: aldo/keto reductase, partial [Pseudomonadota bacterium]|nr:aldo/keto reductase [Pseudomonadota bacterium]